MFINVWLPVWGTANKCRTSSQRSWQFFGVFLFCGSQSARQMNQGRNRKRWFSFGAAESITLRKKKHPPAQKKKKKKLPARYAGYRTNDLAVIWQVSENASFNWLTEKNSTSYNCFLLKVKSKCKCHMLKKFLRSKLTALCVFARQCDTRFFWKPDIESGSKSLPSFVRWSLKK